MGPCVTKIAVQYISHGEKTFTVGFHYRRTQSRSRNQKRKAYDLLKTACRFRLGLRRLRSAY